MADVLLFHHALGFTPGCLAFADELRAGGHQVHVPDLYDGKTFTELDEGVAHARQVGFETVAQRGRRAAEPLPEELVYAGLSLGVMSAQELAQTRPRAKGAVLMHAAFPTAEFGGDWPAGVPLQLHTMADDDWGDVDVARELAATVPGAELHIYPGERHLFADPSRADYDEDAARLLMQRVLGFLDRIR